MIIIPKIQYYRHQTFRRNRQCIRLRGFQRRVLLLRVRLRLRLRLLRRRLRLLRRRLQVRLSLQCLFSATLLSF